LKTKFRGKRGEKGSLKENKKGGNPAYCLHKARDLARGGFGPRRRERLGNLGNCLEEEGGGKTVGRTVVCTERNLTSTAQNKDLRKGRSRTHKTEVKVGGGLLGEVGGGLHQNWTKLLERYLVAKREDSEPKK